MMSPQLLNRATFSFRQGYLDGYFGKDRKYSADKDSLKPFGEFDYNEGYHAGEREAFFNSVPLSERRRFARQIKGQFSIIPKAKEVSL